MSESFEIQPRFGLTKGKVRAAACVDLKERHPLLFMAATKMPQSISLIRKDLEKMLETEAFYTA